METGCRILHLDSLSAMLKESHIPPVIRDSCILSMNRNMSEASIPSVVAMLVCDQVIMEHGTAKKSLIGIFENINVQVFPAPIRLGIYAKLVDAEGDYKFLLRLVHLKDESKVAEIVAEGKGIRREGAAELILNVGLVFPEPGKYELQLYANDAFLHRITMNAVLLSGGGIQWQPPKSHP